MNEPVKMNSLTPNTKVLGSGFGGVFGGFIIDELQNRAHVLLTSMEITMITVLSGLIVAILIPDTIRAILEGQVTSLKNRIDVITAGGNDTDHAPYAPTGEPVATPTAQPQVPTP